MLTKVWDSKPISRHEAAKRHPNATFSRIFGILGLKDSETDSSKFKHRIVVQGSNMKDVNNEHVFYNDTSSAPTNMVCTRSVIAYGQITNSGSTQADAEQAFIQPLLPDDEYIYIYIPQEIIDGHPDLQSAVKGVSNPVFRLRRPLYGWSRSGNIWENHVSEHLKSIKFGTDSWKAFDTWPQTFWKIILKVSLLF